MLNKNYFFNITSNSYSQFLNGHSNNSKSDGYINIDLFHQTMSIHYKNAFLQRKKQNLVHRCLFLLLGCLFALCALLIYWKSPNFNLGLYFNKSETVKNIVDFFSASLSLASFGIGLSIQPEKEAIRFLAKKIQTELNDSSCHVQLELNTLFQNLQEKPHIEYQKDSA